MKTRMNSVINIETNDSVFLLDLVSYLQDLDLWGSDVTAEVDQASDYLCAHKIEVGSREFYALPQADLEHYAKEYVINMIECDGYWGMWNEDFIAQQIDYDVLASEMEIDMDTSDYSDEELLEEFKAFYLHNGFETKRGRAIMQYVINQDEFVEQALATDGIGHFISNYDGEIIEKTEYAFWRVN